jgi:hypothetical protein
MLICFVHHNNRIHCLPSSNDIKKSSLLKKTILYILKIYNKYYCFAPVLVLEVAAACLTSLTCVAEVVTVVDGLIVTSSTLASITDLVACTALGFCPVALVKLGVVV